MKLDLTQLYKSILRFSGLDADSDGYISVMIDDRREPAVMNGARLVLPLEQHLRNNNAKEKIVFHPLSENILRGESDVIIKLREVINVRLNFTFGIIAQSLLSLIASPELHKGLNPDQTELLIAVKDVDETTVKNFTSLMVEGIKNQASKVFLNIYLKRGGSIGTKRYSRVGIYSFNMYEEFLKDSNEIFGVKLRVKDKEAFKQIYQYILPMLVEDTTAYNRGSESELAPFLDCLMKTSISVASRFNDIFDKFGEYIDQSSKLVFDADWVETFDNLSIMIPDVRRVPVQAGNEGGMVVSTQEQQRPSLPVPPPPAQMQPAPPQQYGYTPPYQQPMQQPQLPAVRHTDRGLDWRSMQTANPAMSMSGNAMAPYFQQQQHNAYQQQVAQPPVWASSPAPQYPNQGFANQGFQNQNMQPQGFNPYGSNINPGI